MIPVLEGQDFASAEEFVQALNAARLKNKRKWITYGGEVAGKSVAIKTFDTGHLQILRVNGVCYGGAMDLKVGEWKDRILWALR